jgi:hypothetical protein
VPPANNRLATTAILSIPARNLHVFLPPEADGKPLHSDAFTIGLRARSSKISVQGAARTVQLAAPGDARTHGHPIEHSWFARFFSSSWTLQSPLHTPRSSPTSTHATLNSPPHTQTGLLDDLFHHVFSRPACSLWLDSAPPDKQPHMVAAVKVALSKLVAHWVQHNELCVVGGHACELIIQCSIASRTRTELSKLAEVNSAAAPSLPDAFSENRCVEHLDPELLFWVSPETSLIFH